MGNQYLNQYRSSLPQNQGNQILKLLTSRKDSGEIRTVDEFKTQLLDLTTKLLQAQSAPTLKLFPAIIGKEISSEQYNFLLNRIQDDLSTAFSESDLLEEITSDHYQLINNIALKSIRYALNKLESQVSLYEFLERDTYGFDNARYEKFNSTDISQVSRIDKSVASIYIDPKVGDLVPFLENSLVDTTGDELFLGTFAGGNLFITEATWLANFNSPRGEVDATFKNSTLSNIIDGTKDTFWITPILFKEVQGNGTPMEISLSLGTFQLVSYVKIEPATPYPMVLTQISYIDSLGEEQSAFSSPLEIKNPIRVDFPPIVTNTLILRFKQSNYDEVQFTKQINSNEYTLAIENSSSGIDLNSLSDSLRQTLSSDFILSDIYNLQNLPSQNERYFEYIFGFDNIFVGFSSYNERGIFAAEKLTVSSPGQIALRVKEYRPTQIVGETTITPQEFSYPIRTTSEDNIFYHGSIEYWITAQLFTASNLLATSYTFPLLPLHATRIYHERFVPTIVSGGSFPNEGLLVHYTSVDGMLVYKNGIVLAGTDWAISSSPLTNNTPGNGTPMRTGIKITSLTNPTDIYTVSYNPIVSSSRNIPVAGTGFSVDLSGNLGIRLVPGNIVIFDKDQLPFDIAYANFYLVVLMRRNSSLEEFSPSLDEYLLLTSSVDEQKFTEV